MDETICEIIISFLLVYLSEFFPEICFRRLGDQEKSFFVSLS